MKLRTALGTVAISAVLLGCGGGGGGGMPPVQPPGPLPPPPPSPTADSFRTTEYNRVGPLDQVHAAQAYALGYTGAGVIVGVVDFNFNLNSSEINFHPDSVGPNAQAIALYEAQTGTTAESDPHGQAVAGVIAAKKNDNLVHGIAFDAQVLAVDYFSKVNETQVAQDGVLYHVSDPWTYITSRGSKIINMSFGYEASDIIPNPPVVAEAYVTESPARAVINGAVLVAAAGNAGNPNPSLSNQDIIADLTAANALNGPGGFIIAGSVNATNQISSFSNRAGSLKNYFMVAPGEDVTVLWGSGLAVGSGTSFAAPMISGAAALILDRWPNLTGREVADILSQSATDLGVAGIDSVYGHGLLNIEAALQPMGASNVAVANGTAPAVYATGMVLSPAFGDAPAFRAAL